MSCSTARGLIVERFPPNEMKRVDLRRAKLRGSEFRGLDLDEVLFPEDEDHIVVEDYPQILDRLLAYFGERRDMGSQRLAARFEHKKQWLRSTPTGGCPEQARSYNIRRGTGL